MIDQIIHMLTLVFFIYLAIHAIYFLIFSLAGKLVKKKHTTETYPKKRIAICIPSYNEDEVIVTTAKAAATHNYPSSYFDIFIAADHTGSETIDLLKQERVTVYALDFLHSSKARSLNYLLNSIDEKNYDIALILDGDNIMESGFLEKINTVFNNGYKAVQAHRTAKNRNTTVATLDAISEEINNHLFRKSQRAMGFSSALIGSGMAFEFHQLKKVYNKPGILDNPACDREVDFELTKDNIIIEYLDDTFVFDEKVAQKKIFKKQRRRWLESQLIHLKLFFHEKVSPKTKNYWNKLFINCIPPRIILLVFFLIGILLSWKWGLLLFCIYIVSLIIAVPSRFYNYNTVKALLQLPFIILIYISALIGIKPKRKEFVHTPKSFKK